MYLHVLTVYLFFLQILFRKYGWAKSMYLFPFYRTVARKYNFDDYASKGSTVHPVKKYHRNMEALTMTSGGPAGSTGDLAAILDGKYCRFFYNNL